MITTAPITTASRHTAGGAERHGRRCAETARIPGRRRGDGRHLVGLVVVLLGGVAQPAAARSGHQVRPAPSPQPSPRPLPPARRTRPQRPAAPPVTAFTHVAVIPMDRERLLPDQTVLVHGDRIIALGPAARVAVPAGARQIDGRGKFLIPGLADMHAHIPSGARAAPWMISWLVKYNAGQRVPTLFTPDVIAESERLLFLNLANGVTTVRLLFGMPEMVALKRRAARGELLSPRIYVSAPTINADDSNSQVILRRIRRAKRDGYDLLKLYGFTGRFLDTVAAVARRVGIDVAGHLPGDAPGGLPEDNDLRVMFARAIEAGYRSIEHTYPFARIPDSLDALRTARAVARAGVWWCPTLAHAGYPILDSNPTPWDEARYATDSMRREFIRREFSGIPGRGDSAAWAALKIRPYNNPGEPGSQSIAQLTRTVRVLHDAGVGILLGTDGFALGETPGFQVHRELQALVVAGLTPYEALAAGTSNAARYFNTQDSTGTVAVGKRADLVLLDGNPLDDIRHTKRPAGVMLGGRWLDRAALDARLKTIEGTLVL